MATKHLDEAFWNPSAALASGQITRKEYLEQVSAQCWFYQLLVMLHMPLMIHSIENTELEKYQTSCLDASRNLLKIYHLMRSDTFSAFSMFKLIDHQAFVASVLLVLGLMGYGSVRQIASQEKDRELINLAIVTLRQTSITVNNPIASQAVQGLETLVMMNANGCPQDLGSAHENPYATLVVPSVGVITISPGEHYSNSHPGSTSPNYHPPLEFSLAHDMLQDMPGSADQYPATLSDTALNGEQASGLEPSDNVRTELASIDFDWMNSTTHNFEDDWAWLNNMSY